MSRYFFTVHDGHSTPDTEGIELPDWQTARYEAISLAGHILKDEAKRFLFDQEWWMEVTDVTGLTLFQLGFCLTEAAAVKNLPSGSWNGHRPPSARSNAGELAT